MKANCSNCNKEIDVWPSTIKKSKTGKVYCSHSCSSSINNKLRVGEKHPNYTTGISIYRSLKLDSSNLECENCGIDILCVLQVHHKDGNRKNNKIENLELLCANCHLISHNE